MSDNPFAVLNKRPAQLDTENATERPEPRAAARPRGTKLEKPKAAPTTGRAAGKSSLEGYERLTVYVRKETKDNLVRSLIGTDEDMSDVVQRLLDKHLRT